MKRLMIPLVGLIAVACSNSGTDTAANSTAPATTPPATAPAAATATPVGATGFAVVQPILTANCMPCHSAQRKRGGWAADSFADATAPGSDGPVIVAGDPDKSLLVQVLKGPVANPKLPAMPQGKAPLAAADIQKISDWVKAGAKES